MATKFSDRTFAGSFIVLGIYQALKRDYLGCDLTWQQMDEFMKKK